MKEVITFILIIISLIVLTSCHAYINISGQKDYEAYQYKHHVWVLELKTNQDSTVFFSSSFPGKLSNNEVIGLQQGLLQDFKPDSVLYKGNIKKPTASYALKNGVKYKIINQDKQNRLAYVASDTVCIPFSEIQQMHLKKIALGKTALLVLGIAGAEAGFVLLLVYLWISNFTFF